jgi:dihydrofolate synthase
MIELGLSRITQLVKHTPLNWKAIHVAGTNGKGSITAYISAVLEEAGVVTGRFNSPHLIDRWDCISIHDDPVSQSIFRQTEDAVKSRNEKLGICASEFELLTATAFEVFNHAHVQVGVVEVGLGGRLDATNVLAPKDVLVSVISKIGLDHQSLLGHTLTAIAQEKAGIMKEGVPCIVDGTNELSVLQALCDQAESTRTTLSIVKPETACQTMKLLEPLFRHQKLAPHQQTNLLVAVEALKAAEPSLKLTKSIDESLQVIPRTNWPGRLQMVSLQPLVGQNITALLDGAHNTQAAEALSVYVDERIRRKFEPVTWLLAASKGKDVTGLLNCFIKPHDKVIATRFGSVDGMPWVEPTDTTYIAQASKQLSDQVQVTETETVEVALRCLAKTQLSGPIVVTGSLYLVSDVLRLLRASESSRTQCS